MTIIIIVAYIVITLLEVIPLFKNQQKKEMILYINMMVIALVLSVLLSRGIKIPSPAVFIEKLITSIIGG
ncbi:hypothetical protein OW763_12665 [Clostridium aestuarii]|uniref:Uncharacterized protein n=1 Tax=Clostridium aestuarii TaxID=338193 RepID=A0ABT4D1R5_9CLOT|nr:hypothetical protein [Clostridium aestuarii]MCY6485191.1 hypothetical protein [Clostridium aestuarii]